MKEHENISKSMLDALSTLNTVAMALMTFQQEKVGVWSRQDLLDRVNIAKNELSQGHSTFQRNSQQYFKGLEYGYRDGRKYGSQDLERALEQDDDATGGVDEPPYLIQEER